MAVRNRRLFVLTLGWVIILFHLVCPGNAHAYIDPGSGSYIFQILIGGFMAAGFMLRQFRGRAVEFFRSVLGKFKEKTSAKPREVETNDADEL